MALAALIVLAAGLLHSHLSGAGTFIGDSDRLNTFLNIRELQIRSIQQRWYVPAWNEGMFMGINTTGLHWMLAVADPIAYIEALFPEQLLFQIAGFVAVALLVAAACTAYLYFYDVCRNRVASIVGATLYISSAFSLGRITQVDNAFAVLIFAPLALLALRRVKSGHLRRPFVALVVVLAAILWFTFLQDAAYIFLLLGCYALYKTARLRSLWPAILFGSAVVLAAVLAFPRLLTIYQEVTLLSRAPQNTLPCSCELLRWFDDGIMGRFPQEVDTRSNPVNLHEGVQIYTSTLVPLVIMVGAGSLVGWPGRLAAAIFYALFGVVAAPLIGSQWALVLALALLASIFVRSRWRAATVRSAGDEKPPLATLDVDAPFHLAFLGLALAVMLWAPAQQLLYLLFLKLDFIHARISVAAVLSIGALVSVFLAERLGDWQWPTRRFTPAAAWIVATCAAFGILWAVDAAGRGAARALADQVILLQLGRVPAHLQPADVARVLMIGLAFTVLIGVYGIARDGLARRLAGATLAVTMLLQAWTYAEFQLSGPQTWSFPRPFEGNDYFNAPLNAMHPPSSSAIDALRGRLETDRYRSVIMAPADGFPMFSAPSEHGYTAYLAQNWQLRLVDGYPTLPGRLATLPWPPLALSVRSLSFRADTQLPWPLLSVLNVKYALIVNQALYFDTGSNGEARPEDFQVEQNPLAVTPREFFAQSVRSVPPLVVPGPPPPARPNAQPPPPVWSVIADPARLAAGTPPVTLAARAISSSQVELSWTDAVQPARYDVEQMKIGETDFRAVGSTTGATRSFGVAGLEPLSPYIFHVRRCEGDACESTVATVAIATLSSLSSSELKNLVPSDPVRESVAEGFEQAGQFSTDGDVRVGYDEDRVDISVSASAQPRFLVLNELYHPAWRAFANGSELTIYPTNTVMRGLLVPPGVTHVEMLFQPFMLTPPMLVFVVIGALLSGACVWYLGRVQSQDAQASPRKSS